MNSQFWLLRPPDKQRLGEEIDTEYEKVVCPVTGGHARVGRRISDLSIMIQPRYLRDFTWTWYSDILVSRRSWTFSGASASPATKSDRPGSRIQRKSMIHRPKCSNSLLQAGAASALPRPRCGCGSF